MSQIFSLRNLFASLLLLVCVFTAYGQHINFEKGSWSDIIKKAKNDEKYIFVFVYSDSCAACERMSNNVFKDSTVYKHFNRDFINYKLNATNTKNGRKFSKNFAVGSTPSLLFFTPNAVLKAKESGAKSAQELIKTGKWVYDSTLAVFKLRKEFKAGKHDTEFMKLYLTELLESDLDYTETLELYFKSISKKDFFKQENFDFIIQGIKNPYSETFKYVLKNRTEFADTFGKKEVDRLIENIYDNALGEFDLNASKSKKKRLMKEIAEHDPRLHARLEYNYNKDKKDEFKYARVYFENYCSNYEQLNEIAWQYFETETNKTKLEAALIWAEKSIGLNKNWYNLDTKANLLNKLGKKKEALAAAEEALEIAKAAGEDPSETEKLIKSLKN